MKYIKNVSTLEELKKEYKKLALKLHPDMPTGNEQAMKDLNNEYDSLFAKLKNTHKNNEGEFYTKETEETMSEWKEIINDLFSLKMIDVEIEVIGSFLWVTGNTKPYKDSLKKIGLKWGAKKQAWYLSPKGYKRHGKKNYEMNEIRSMYGSKMIKKSKKEEKTKVLQSSF